MKKLIENIQQIIDFGQNENLSNVQIAHNISQYCDYFNEFEYAKDEVSKNTKYFVHGNCSFCVESGTVIPF